MESHSFFQSNSLDFNLVKGDCLTVIPKLDNNIDMVFADPPYFLSNDGLNSEKWQNSVC